jgi:hypothetical protein
MTLKDERRRAADVVSIRAEMKSAHELENSVVIQQRADERSKSRAPESDDGSIPPRAKGIVAVLNALGKLPMQALFVILVLLGLLAFLGPDLVKAIWG